MLDLLTIDNVKVLYVLAKFFLSTGSRFISQLDLCGMLRQSLPKIFQRKIKAGVKQYLVRTHTADFAFAGTDAFISIKLVDLDGKETEWFHLDNPGINDFKTGATDEFLLEPFEGLLPKNIKVIQIRNEGGGVGETWLLDKVEVETANPNSKAVFPVYSWIEVSPDPRAFFDSQSLTLEETPDRLKQFRALEIQRCQDLYRYEIYNDLSKGAMRRAPLTNYIRRVAGVDATLPLDERFDQTKTRGFGFNAIAGLIPRKVLEILTSQTSMSSRGSLNNVSWSKYYHLKQAFWLMGIWYYYIPAISKRWKEDLEFGRLRIAGVNPVMIRLLRPDETILADANITEDTVRGLLPDGHTLRSEVLKQRVYYVNYRTILTDEWRKEFNTTNRYVTSPIAVFYVNAKKQLVPLAIQLEKGQEPFTPNDKEEDWLIAKIHFSSVDSGVHQLYTHYTRAHANSEAFSIAARRQLHPTHPVYKLLKPHFRYTMAINSKARARLINADGHVERAFFTGPKTMNFAEFAYEQLFDFGNEYLPRNLKDRGVDNPDALPHYPYRDDGLEVWEAIKTMVKDYLTVYYPESEDYEDPQNKKRFLNRKVLSDSELQNWYKDATENGHHGKTFEPLKNRKTLINAITTIIWNATAHHACVNFAQYEITSYGLVQPPHCRLPPPAKGQGTEERVMQTIPDLMTNCLVISVTKTLSSYAAKGEEEYLGHTREVTVYEPAALEVLKEFQNRLKRIETNIAARDKERKAVYGVEYPYLRPSKISNSVAI